MTTVHPGKMPASLTKASFLCSYSYFAFDQCLFLAVALAIRQVCFLCPSSRWVLFVFWLLNFFFLTSSLVRSPLLSSHSCTISVGPTFASVCFPLLLPFRALSFSTEGFIIGMSLTIFTFCSTASFPADVPVFSVRRQRLLIVSVFCPHEPVRFHTGGLQTVV